jgi:hypothetical protein
VPSVGRYLATASGHVGSQARKLTIQFTQVTVMSEITPPPTKPRAPVKLSDNALRWLEQLDEKIRPQLLPDSYPRIANRFADIWIDPEFTRKYFDELLVDERGTRQGFPDSLVLELSTLKHHYDTVLCPVKEDVWTKIWSQMGEESAD